MTDVQARWVNMALDPTQGNLLQQFKDKVKPLLHDKFRDKGDEWLIKWVVAANNDVDDAVDAFRAHMEWRVKYAVDELPHSYRPPPVFATYQVGGFVGPDKKGHPVLFLPFSLADIRGLRRSTSVDDWIRHAVSLLEEGKRLCRLRSDILGKPVTRINLVFDIDHIPHRTFLWRPFFEVLFFLIRMFEQNYPEYLNKAVVMNSPPLFSVALKVFGQGLKKSTLEKITIMGHGKDEWTKVILEDVEAENWPAYWGGELKEGVDAKCSAALGRGGNVSPSYFIHPENDPPSELLQNFTERATPIIRERMDSVTGPVVRERLETIAGHLLSERLVTETGNIIREMFETQVGPISTEFIQTVSGPMVRERIETSGGTLLRETLESETGRKITERLEAATARIGQEVDSHLAQVASQLASAAELLNRRFDNEEVYHIPREFKMIYPVKIRKGGSVIRWIYFLEGTDIDFVVKYDPDMDAPVVKQVREALAFDPISLDETRKAIVVPRVRINGSTDPVEDSLECERPGVYYLEFSNAYSRRKSKVLHIAVEIDEPKKETGTPTSASSVQTIANVGSNDPAPTPAAAPVVAKSQPEAAVQQDVAKPPKTTEKPPGSVSESTEAP